ncbi:Hint domain-containing protein [Sulfitobacter donghicola]|uniref:Calcium-binding protein n=1 Tax=Sulfitobacter donghicola DSW-25 = KCTC 12864 = JCM 14565 TaxID=1300350 RepID=A0A073IEC4_9RHOB|nr:Hint domain-containing protein [Sulfitobacter donghicola]KEJ88059.1 calcium-binding protein [Sulfitobacter donghicola DSW-25 = KCTC 12864 = JCM 14565]KIN68725.1 Hemolysin-type calcium-binding protein [Sulfitobacter donghicola DSW-25 = KCTC 12864 = JCM 14565]
MATIDIVRQDINPHETTSGIRDDTSSRGVDLEGTIVTATYADGTTETLTWQAYDPYTFGGVTGTDVDMSFGFDWHNLSTSKRLTSLKFDLQPANSVFDTTLDMDDFPIGNSTPSSLNGFPFKLAPEYEDIEGAITATYSGIVNLAGSAAVGDLYTTMEIDFSGLPDGGLLGELRWNSDIDTIKADNDLVPTGVTCFARGTLITTDRGDLPVEDLRPGDKILTQDNGYQTLLLTMNRVMEKRELRKNTSLYPVRICAGALGGGIPKRDLVVSRQHRMVVRSNIAKRMFGDLTVLVAAIRLAKLPRINVEYMIRKVEYFHLIFKNHEIIFAEGAPTESFLINSDTKNTLSTQQRKEFFAIFPEAAENGYCAEPAYAIPPLGGQKRLVQRHRKNERRLLSAQMG